MKSKYIYLYNGTFISLLNLIKELNYANEIKYPLEKSDKYIFNIVMRYEQIRGEFFANTTNSVRNAQQETKNLVEIFIKEFEKKLENNPKKSKFIEIQKYKHFKYSNKKKYEYFSNLNKINIPFEVVENDFRTLIWENISELRNNIIILNARECLPHEKEEAKRNIENFTIMINAIMQVYCDNVYKKELIDYCVKYNLIEPMYPIFNSPFSAINKDDFATLFHMAEQNKIPLEEVKENLVNWQNKTIENVYSEYKEYLAENGNCLNF